MKLLRSNQLLGVNQGLRATLKRWKTTFLFMFLLKPYVSLSCIQWKKYLFGNFQAFFIVFDHVNTCASMPLLIETHNRQMNWEYTYQSTPNHFILFYSDFTRARRRNRFLPTKPLLFLVWFLIRNSNGQTICLMQLKDPWQHWMPSGLLKFFTKKGTA